MFQMKELGPLGIIGVHALEPAMQICDHVKCFLVVTGHAQALLLTQDPVIVSTLSQKSINSLESNLQCPKCHKLAKFLL